MSTLNLATVDKLSTTNLNTTNLIVEENFEFKRMNGTNFLSSVTDSISDLSTDVNNKINNANSRITEVNNNLNNRIDSLNTNLNAMQGVPVPSTQDNGKILTVVNGVVMWANISDAEGVAF